MLGSDVASITNMITAPLDTRIKLNEKDQKKFDDFKKNAGRQSESKGGLGLISAFLEKKANAKQHLRHLLADNKGKWWNKGKQEVQNRVERGKKYANEIKSDFSKGGIFSEDGVDIVKKRFSRRNLKIHLRKGMGHSRYLCRMKSTKRKMGLREQKIACIWI